MPSNLHSSMTAGTITEAVKAGGLEGKCPVDHTQVQQVPTPAPEQAKCPVDHTKVQKVPAPENEKCPVEHTKVTVEESRSSDATTSTESTQPLSSDSVQTSATPQKLTSAQVFIDSFKCSAKLCLRTCFIT